MSGGHERRGGEDGSTGSRGDGAGLATPGKHSRTQLLARRDGGEADDAFEATRGTRSPEGAADRASGRALERDARESLEEHRATLSLDRDLLDEADRHRAMRRNPRLQRRLGWDPIMFSIEPVDSEGFALDVAVIQTRGGLRVDGICGPRTCEAAGVPVRRRAPPGTPPVDATDAAFEATRGVRNADGAAERASGSALERDLDESIEEHRATLDLDAEDDLDEGPSDAPAVPGRAATTSSRGPTLKEIVQLRRATETVPPPRSSAPRPLTRRLDLGAGVPMRAEQTHEATDGAVAPREGSSDGLLATIGADRFAVFPHEPTLDEGSGVVLHIVPTAGDAPRADGNGVEVSWRVIDPRGELVEHGRYRWTGDVPTPPPFQARVVEPGRHEIRIDIVESHEVRKQVVRSVQVRGQAVRDAHEQQMQGDPVDLGEATPAPGLGDHDASNRGAIRRELERIIAARGMQGARDHIRDVVNRRSQGVPRRGARIGRPLMEELEVYEAEARTLLDAFRGAGRSNAHTLLDEGQRQVENELRRYGIQMAAGGDHRMGPGVYRAGPQTAELEAMAHAARDLVALKTKLDAYGGFATGRWGDPGAQAEAMDAFGSKQVSADEVQVLALEYEARLRMALQQYPSLHIFIQAGRHKGTPRLEDLGDARASGIAPWLGWELNQKLADIAASRYNLTEKELSVFAAPRVVELTKHQLHIAPGTYEDGIIDEAVRHAGDQGWTETLLAVFSLALGLALAVPTGGTSAAGAAVAVGEVALVAADLYMLSDLGEDYGSRLAANNTALDRGQSLIQQEPDATELILAIVTAPLGGAGAVRALQEAAIGVQKVRQLRQAIREAAGDVADARVVALGGDLRDFASAHMGDGAEEWMQAVLRKSGSTERADSATARPSFGARRADSGPEASGRARFEPADLEDLRPTALRAGEGIWETAAKPGVFATDAAIAHGTVRMEDHPGYADLIREVTSKGFAIVLDNKAHVAHVKTLDMAGNVIELRRELHVIPGMRFLDLEHEVGHIRQLERFGDDMPATEVRVRMPDGQIKKARGNSLSGILRNKQAAVVEYHNRLVEYIRLAERGAPERLLREHADGIAYWAEEARKAGVGYDAGEAADFASEFFPDIFELEARCRGLGLNVARTKRW